LAFSFERNPPRAAALVVRDSDARIDLLAIDLAPSIRQAPAPIGA